MLINLKNRQLEILFNNSKLKLPDNLKKQIHENWLKFTKETPNLWNGEIFCVNSLEENNNKITLKCSKTDYAHYLYDYRIGCKKEYGSYGLSGGVFFETSDGYYIIGKLAETTSFPHGLSIQGGGIDNKDIKDNKIIDIKSTMRREALEEINLDICNKNQVENFEIRYISPATDTIKTYEIIGKAKLKLTAKEVRNHFEKYYKYLEENKLEQEYEDILLLKKETAYEELKNMENPKRKYLLDIVKE